MSSLPIGKLFLNEGLIDESILKAALESQPTSGEKLGDHLVNQGCVTEEERLKVLSSQFGIPYIISKDYARTPPTIENTPTIKFLKHYKVVPTDLTEGVLKVATSDPVNHFPVEAIAFATGLEVDVVLGAESDILDVIEAYYGSGPVTMEKIIAGIDDKEAGSTWDIDDVEQLTDMAQEAPVINLVNILISKAVEKKASDIHVEPYEDNIKVRYRVDGILFEVETIPKRLHPAISSRIKIMSKLNIAERRLPQDGRFKLRHEGKEVDIRVSTIPTLYGESIVMRLLDTEGVMSLESVGFNSASRDAFSALINQPHGMVLVTGPTGSGKSTTLYAGLSKIDISQKKVITIEDPIEYQLEGVNQIQVKPKIGLTFANGLRSIVRQDPDVMMIGEIRDAETANIAIHSALTGHMILSTLHTNDAPGAITRLIDMGVEGYLISSSLLGVLAQRLVRVICEACKEAYTPDKEHNERLISELCGSTETEGVIIYRGAGCEECGNTGYKGRTGVFELMTVNDEIRQMIVDKKSSNDIRKKARENGMVTLREDGWAKVLAGVTTLEEIVRVTLEQDGEMDQAAFGPKE